jgi:hypothetical protein
MLWPRRIPRDVRAKQAQAGRDVILFISKYARDWVGKAFFEVTLTLDIALFERGPFEERQLCEQQKNEAGGGDSPLQ